MNGLQLLGYILLFVSSSRTPPEYRYGWLYSQFVFAYVVFYWSVRWFVSRSLRLNLSLSYLTLPRAIRLIGYPKWISVAVVPFAVLGTALLIQFCTPESHVGYLVMCQLFNGIYSGVWALTVQLVLMASVNHQEVAVVIALFGLFDSIGAAIGVTIAGALWTNILPTKLEELLPEGFKDQAVTIYGDVEVQMSYADGDPVRAGNVDAYSDVQRKMVITGVAFIPIRVILLFFWKNINVKTLEKEKGNQSKSLIW